MKLSGALHKSGLCFAGETQALLHSNRRQYMKAVARLKPIMRDQPMRPPENRRRSRGPSSERSNQ
jgi:hypothetical protein